MFALFYHSCYLLLFLPSENNSQVPTTVSSAERKKIFNAITLGVTHYHPTIRSIQYVMISTCSITNATTIKKIHTTSAKPRKNTNFNITTQSLSHRTPPRLPQTPVGTPRRSPLPPCNDSTNSIVTPLRLPRREEYGEQRASSFHAVR